MEIIVGAKLRENDRTNSVIILQDKIRSKIKGWNGTEEIRKWKEKRAS